jgi:hypothetical protein
MWRNCSSWVRIVGVGVLGEIYVGRKRHEENSTMRIPTRMSVIVTKNYVNHMLLDHLRIIFINRRATC